MSKRLHTDTGASRRPSADLTARLDEQLLVERIRLGDPLAFEAIFRRHYPELCAVAERVVGSRAAAEDVVQDVFLAVWASREQWQVSVGVRAYLRRAVRNMALRHASMAAVRRRVPLAEIDTPGAAVYEAVLREPAPSAEQHMEAAAIGEVVTRVTANFPPRMAQVYRLSRGEGLTTREIAKKLRISPNTVEIHLTRALALLRSAITTWHAS